MEDADLLVLIPRLCAAFPNIHWKAAPRDGALRISPCAVVGVEASEALLSALVEIRMGPEGTPVVQIEGREPVSCEDVAAVLSAVVAGLNARRSEVLAQTAMLRSLGTVLATALSGRRSPRKRARGAAP